MNTGKAKGLNARLPPAGEHPAKAKCTEMDLQVVNIVNGYRQPKLLRDECGSARTHFADSAVRAQFLRSAMQRLDAVEKLRRFRLDSVATLSSGTGAGTGGGGAGTATASSVSGQERALSSRPAFSFSAAKDKGERFFDNLAQTRLPLEECFDIPKLGLGLFVQGLIKFFVPPPRAVWALRAAYPKDMSADLIREVFEKSM